MNKIINGKKYDTKTAKLLGTYRSGTNTRDFYYWEESLFRTKSGNFFIYGCGNAASKYSKQTAYNEWSGDETIIPISYDVAKEWAEEYLNGDKYEAIFGEVDDNGEATIAISSKALRKLQEMQSRESRPIKSIIDELVGV